MNAIIAVVIFLGLLLVIGFFCSRTGNLSFWKLVRRIPDQAFDWFRNDPAWVVVQKGAQPPEPRSHFDGPFKLSVPKLGATIRVYGKHDEFQASEQRFLQTYKSQVSAYRFPALSALALVYPVVAMLFLGAHGAVVTVLGIGLTQLSYLLCMAFIFPGHFRVLGLDSRVSTIVLAVIAWVAGMLIGVADYFSGGL